MIAIECGNDPGADPGCLLRLFWKTVKNQNILLEQSNFW